MHISCLQVQIGEIELRSKALVDLSILMKPKCFAVCQKFPLHNPKPAHSSCIYFFHIGFLASSRLFFKTKKSGSFKLYLNGPKSKKAFPYKQVGFAISVDITFIHSNGTFKFDTRWKSARLKIQTAEPF
jgi:hypothetical protein